MAEVVQVQKREGKLGTAASQRLRQSGQIPAVLYGHKQENEHLSIDRKTVESILRHHSKIVELEGAVKETALVSDLQFDPLGIEVLHIDLQRVDMNERVTVTVPIRFKGDPAGGKQGGIVIENAHEVEVSCPAVAIPESISLNVTPVKAGEHRSAGDLTLPENVELVTPADTVVFHIEKPKGAKAATDAEEGDE
ncbi:50S ribosomal protein L25 [Rhodopirellula sp. MGV]|uniref:50S ribosomal protein L25 n=1 Tax=Rhodopirellula sp. MGV TaxID=2023130 RepID=UPI000B95F82B|nr:50S ribosomal protein L25 [Rhodopirellula sp. MGV]OYP34724.1 50S ribosomal protein L25 [Rhodopirellula sp. MGV]PNY34321.1 50S ribosomal protein L25 [Rhodopirellula baltica]